MLKNFILARILACKGELLVGRVKSATRKNVYYSVSNDTHNYSFWYWNLQEGLHCLETNLSRNEAQFKMVLLGGVG